MSSFTSLLKSIEEQQMHLQCQKAVLNAASGRNWKWSGALVATDVECALTLTSTRKKRRKRVDLWCLFLPITQTGMILKTVHMCHPVAGIYGFMNLGWICTLLHLIKGEKEKKGNTLSSVTLLSIQLYKKNGNENLISPLFCHHLPISKGVWRALVPCKWMCHIHNTDQCFQHSVNPLNLLKSFFEDVVCRLMLYIMMSWMSYLSVDCV